jgi:hypothetical protein
MSELTLQRLGWILFHWARGRDEALSAKNFRKCKLNTKCKVPLT